MSRELDTAKTCNTCCRPYASPWRVYDERGKVIHGCVDECHGGHLVTPSESARWHARPEAKKLRAELKRFFGKTRVAKPYWAMESDP